MHISLMYDQKAIAFRSKTRRYSISKTSVFHPITRWVFHLETARFSSEKSPLCDRKIAAFWSLKRAFCAYENVRCVMCELCFYHIGRAFFIWKIAFVNVKNSPLVRSENWMLLKLRNDEFTSNNLSEFLNIKWLQA